MRTLRSIRFHALRLLFAILILFGSLGVATAIFDASSVLNMELADQKQRVRSTLEFYRSALIRGDFRNVRGLLEDAVNILKLDQMQVDVKSTGQTITLEPALLRRKKAEISHCSKTGFALLDVILSGCTYSHASIYFDHSHKSVLATATWRSKSDVVFPFLKKVALYLGFFSLIGLLLVLLLNRFLSRFINKPIQFLNEHFRFADAETLSKLKHSYNGKQLVEMEKIFSGVENLANRLGDASKRAAYGELARQVAHDIRSPLAALKVVVQTSSRLPEQERLLVQSAAERIQDIANNLIEQNKSPGDQEPQGGEAFGSYLLSSLIEEIISEKRTQYKKEPDISINKQSVIEDYDLFAKIVPGQLKRILSNLINNAVEALPEKSGLVNIALSKERGQAVIRITDSGTGIPSDVISKVGTMGFTYGKEGGTGLGLYHAIRTLKSWNGSVNIKSKMGEGTEIKLTLPVAAPPWWFVSKIQIPDNSTVVILDDDPSIHVLWDRKLLLAMAKNVRSEHFRSEMELEKWHRTAYEPHSNIIFLVDHELIGSHNTGVALIEKLGIQKQSILVTNKYAEPLVQKACQNLGIKIIPKVLANHVPIKLIRTKMTKTQLTEKIGN